MKIAIYGSSGNMGLPTLKEVVKLDFIEHINLVLHSKKGAKKVKKALKKSEKNKVSFFFGSIANKEVVEASLKDVDILINMAAVIPPLSDKNPKAAIEVNEEGVKTICKVIEEQPKQTKLIHISTVGLFGNRNELHVLGEIGDPLLVAPYDIYAVTKMRGEFTVLESNVKTWAVIRQSAMLYDELLMKNVSDGLMFHTCYNAPLEWVTAHDSATLIKNILFREYNNELNESNFWKKCFNLAAGIDNRKTGFETLDEGFKIIGGSAKDFFDTNYNSLRNFHGLYYRDGYKLEELFHYQHDKASQFWLDVLKKHPYFSLAKLLPKKLIKALVIKPLLKDDNAPRYWYKHGEEGKIIACFGSVERYENIDKDWNKFPLNAENRSEYGGEIDYNKIRNDSPRLNHYFDNDKPDSEIDIEDLKNVAKAHGGKLITKEFTKGDIYHAVEWENQDKERFFARPFSVLKAGHWMNISYKEYAWDFDRLAKKDKIYAQIWYDTHSKDENYYYYLDENFKGKYKVNE